VIENLTFIRIKNGWILTIRDKGMVRENVEDIFFKNQEEIIDWIRENLR